MAVTRMADGMKLLLLTYQVPSYFELKQNVFCLPMVGLLNA